jgi:hypothetical protein
MNNRGASSEDYLRAGAVGSLDDRRGVEVALPRGGRAEPDGLVGGAHVQRGAVGVAVHSHRGYAEPPRGAHHPARDLAPVRHQHLLDPRRPGGRVGGGGGGGEEPRGEDEGKGRGAPAEVEAEEAGGHHAVRGRNGRCGGGAAQWRGAARRWAGEVVVGGSGGIRAVTSHHSYPEPSSL